MSRIIKKATIVALAVVLAINLCGCSEKIRSGEIINKEYTPAHKETKHIPITIYTGKFFSTVMIPQIFSYDDKWEITIRKLDERKSDYLTATYIVTKDVFESYNIGEQFEYTESMNPKNLE